jgi:hypothetical protein
MSLLKNDNAISEEFTSLPALSVIMIGFTLFFVLIANVYHLYDSNVASIEKYQTADFIATKLTGHDCGFVKEGGIIDLPALEQYCTEGNNEFDALREEYQHYGINFSIIITWEDVSQCFPEDSVPSDHQDRIAVSKKMGIYINEAQTVPGEITVLLWDEY